MTTLREAAQQALDAKQEMITKLAEVLGYEKGNGLSAAAETLRAVLAQPDETEQLSAQGERNESRYERREVDRA